MHILIILAFFATAHGRAVNISNTWVLPEEGFPVFYRYFRDRISWYEADAVCQFHHANLVTVDTTAQYDAVRAYLKELDISTAVWVGLIRSNPEGDFTWTDYRGLSGDGYWSSAPDPRTAPLCAAADPIADYRWEARTCGGPTVASFICELPVPQWALGSEGCMVRALPALTILYLPESAAVQLTADCGLAGVKRVQCTGNVKREDLLRDLSCAEEVELSSSSINILLNNTTTDVTTENQELSSTMMTEENLSVEHENEHDNSPQNLTPTPFPINENVTNVKISEEQSTAQPVFNEMSKIIIGKNINVNEVQDNNLQSNDIPNLVNNNNFLTNYRIQKMEDEENIQHKKLHDELARLGNFETIFTQPTDHFVPPLVIAKARLSDDMTVLSLKEKHAQHFGTHGMLKHGNEENKVIRNPITSTEDPNEIDSVVELSTEQTLKLKVDLKKDIMKNAVPKKYKDFNSKLTNFSKSKNLNKRYEMKENINETKPSLITTSFIFTSTLPTTTIDVRNENQDEAYINLTVTLGDTKDGEESIHIKDNGTDLVENNMSKHIADLAQAIVTANLFNETQFVMQNNTSKILNNIDDEKNKLLESKKEEHSVIISSKDYNHISQTIDFTTQMPVFKDELINSSTTNMNVVFNNSNISSFNTTTESSYHSSVTVGDLQYTTSNTTLFSPPNIVTKASYKETTEISHTDSETTTVMFSIKSDNFEHETFSTFSPVINETLNITENMEEIENSSDDTTEIDDDFQSPLLSAANEPLQKPFRSRRPRQPNRGNKFNPFRILG